MPRKMQRTCNPEALTPGERKLLKSAATAANGRTYVSGSGPVQVARRVAAAKLGSLDWGGDEGVGVVFEIAPSGRDALGRPRCAP